MPAVYRRLGWEVAGALQRVGFDTAWLPSVPAPGVSVRPGEPAGPRAELLDYSWVG